MDSIDLNELTVLVTGVGGGIGKSIVKHLTPKVKTLISASRSSDISEVWEDSWGEIPKNYTHYSADLTREKQIVDLVKKVYSNHGELNVFVNTIGGSLFSHKIEDFPVDEFDKVISLNLRSAFILTKETIKVMKENKNPKGGNIIHFVSSSAKKISSNKAPYGVAKAGLAHLIHYAAVEASEYNIKVNGITPTYVFTDRHIQDIKKKVEKDEKSEKEILDHIFSEQVIKKKLFPDDMIEVLEVLIKTQVITGQIYNVCLGEILNY